MIWEVRLTFLVLQLSHQKKFDIQLHGLLLWISMGFLMPVGILTIRMSGRLARGSTQIKVYFYLHVVLQVNQLSFFILLLIFYKYLITQRKMMVSSKIIKCLKGNHFLVLKLIRT